MLVRSSILLLSVLSAGSCTTAQEPTPRELLQEASTLYGDGSYAEAAVKAQAAAELETENVILIQRAAELVYRSGFARDSLPLFERVVEMAPPAAPENWQRGIALCSCGEWEKGAAQFKTHHDVNPDDVENSAWYFLCVAKTKGLDAARQTVIPSGGDGRQPMMSVLKMLQGKIEPNEVIEAAITNTVPGSNERMRAQFYADLYVGLYYDCLDDATKAEEYLKRSLSYGSQGYMSDVARVYLKDRFPESRSKKNSD